MRDIAEARVERGKRKGEREANGTTVEKKSQSGTNKELNRHETVPTLIGVRARIYITA